MNDIIKVNIIQERSNLSKQNFSQIIPCQKRESSPDKKKIKIKLRTESSQMVCPKIYNIDNYNYNYNSIINNSKKNIIYNNQNINENEFYNNINYQTKKINDIKNLKDNNITEIITFFQSKEKTRTFNRQSSYKKVKNNSEQYKNKTNIISNNTKKNLDKSKGEIYKKKLINENIYFINNNNVKNINIKNKDNIINNTNSINLDGNSSKRNTDSIMYQSNQENTYDENISKTKEKTNKVKSKIINIDMINNSNSMNNNFNYTINPKNIKLKEPHQEKNFKNNIVSKKSAYPIPINNNIKNNNLEGFLKKKKNIDINIEFQSNPIDKNIVALEKNQIINDLNNTTGKVKIKTNNIMDNKDTIKNRDSFQFIENNSIIKNKSKVKMKFENKKDQDIQKKDINIIFNNKRIIANNVKNKKIEINNKELPDDGPKDSYNNKTDLNKNINLQINNEINNRCTKVKILPKNNEPVNRNNTYNNESSFFTMNINNSNIDENNFNEPKNNLGNYCFVNNAHYNDNVNNFNSNYKFNNGNNYIINNIYNDKNNNKINNNIYVLKSNSNTNKNIGFPNFQIFNENKNIFKNFTSNNNFSNCNTRNTSNNIYNQNYNNNDIIKKEKESNENEVNNKNFETKINDKEKKKDQLVLIELEEEKGPEDNDYNFKNLNNRKEIIEPNILRNKKITEELKEKDLSLDKSTLRVFPFPQEDFIEKDDEVLKILNSQSPGDNNEVKNNNDIISNINTNIDIISNINKIKSNIHQNNEEDESEIIIQNSEFSMMNDPSKYSYNFNKNAFQSSNIYGSNNNNLNNNNSNIILDNVTMKDTSIMSNFGLKGCKSITQAGKERTGHRKKNQDNYIIEKNLNNILGFNLFAILDGHGDNGHLVSQLASKYIIKKFSKITNDYNDTEKIYNFLKNKDFQKIIDIFLEIDKEIIEQKKFDISLSGTTCVLVIQLNEHLICANIGDSRAILIYDENKIFELSHDSKPNVPEEKKRINLMGGVVEQVEDENGEKTGPYRVYIKDKEQPGLAMSRSFGDKKAKSCGVIPYPDIIEYNLNNDSKYMVLCSDGVWEFISNEEVMEIGNKYYNQNNMTEFCNELLKKSTEIWENEETYIDDITIVTVFF